MPVITDLPIWTENGYEIRTQGNVGTTPTNYTYNGSMQSYIFRNDGEGSITLTISGIAVTVVSGEMVTGGALSSFTVVASTGTASWTMRAFELAAQQNTSSGTGTSGLLTFQNAATALGNGTEIDVSAYTTLTVRVSISATATVQFEESVDGTNWTNIVGRTPAGGFNLNTQNLAGSGEFTFAIAGFKFMRFRISAYTSGTVTVTGYASGGASPNFNGVISQFGNVDTNGATNYLQGVGAYNLLYDGSNWSRRRSVVDGLTTGIAASHNLLYGGTVYQRQSSASNIPDGTAGAVMGGSASFGFMGTGFDRVRFGKVYKWMEYITLPTGTASTVWTPAAGKKFRLMGVQISTSAAAQVHLRDGAGGTRFHSQRTGGADTKDFNFGNGYLSAAANNVLEILNSTGSSVDVWVTAWGTEE